ncbi:MAG: pyridoxamine 5'-phosphate oxidase family protein [Chloroflexi bacterium]|nr:MAG: pyridoxamine 5'-phosphate oxidase family protein [Chloroflexota bacterium]
MLETPEELSALQALLDRSHGGGGAHLGSIVTDERRLTALQVANYLQGVKHVAFATVNSRGEPMVAALDGWFLHGQFIASTAAGALRVQHVRRNSAVSLVHMVGDEVGIWVHGTARLARREEPLIQEYDRLATAAYGTSPYSWGDDIAVMPVEARVMFAYAPDPSKYP